MEIAFTDYSQADLDVERKAASPLGFVLREPEKNCRSESEVVAFAKGAAAIIPQEAPITRAVLEALPELRIVSLPQVGVNTVDLEAARELGIWVANVPDGNATEVASHAAAMALALTRHLPAFDASVRSGEWHYEATGALTRPATQTVGVVGFGRIGRLLARYLGAIFGRILAYDPFAPDEGWPEQVARADTLEDLLAESDIVSIHMPLTPETDRMIDAARFAQMKPGAILINVGRGPIVDTAALIEALDQGHLAGAGLDVLPVEPPAPDDPVLRHPRVLLSPHAAFYSVQSDEETRRRSIETIGALLKNGRPNDVVVEGTR